MAIAAADLDTFGGSDTRSYDRQCSFEGNPLWERLNESRRRRLSNLNYSLNHRDDFVVAGWLGTVRILHPGLECNLMDQYLVSLSSLEREEKKAEKFFD